jgi:hypothetical protein
MKDEMGWLRGTYKGDEKLWMRKCRSHSNAKMDLTETRCEGME